jgi:hypothetical protein
MQTQGPTPGKRRRTWLWILVAVFGLGVVCVIAIAGFAMHFFATHVSTKALSPAEAFKAFDVAKAPFKDQPPLFEMDDRERITALPFWALRLWRQKIDVGTDVFDMKRMDLDIRQLERAGSLLVLDHRDRTGQRVLIWTQ